MKLITAIIRPGRLAPVKKALVAADVRGMTLQRVHGHGGQGGRPGSYRGSPYRVEFLEKVELKIAVSDAYVDRTVEAIASAARTGDVGDGKIFVQPLDRVIRIRTGEEDDDALTPVTTSSAT
ncbi:MAG: P-II family nitrogen regulator [Trueperaceae bacterium]